MNTQLSNPNPDPNRGVVPENGSGSRGKIDFWQSIKNWLLGEPSRTEFPKRHKLDALVLEDRILYSASPLLALGDYGQHEPPAIDQLDELLAAAWDDAAPSVHELPVPIANLDSTKSVEVLVAPPTDDERSTSPSPADETDQFLEPTLTFVDSAEFGFFESDSLDAFPPLRHELVVLQDGLYDLDSILSDLRRDGEQRSFDVVVLNRFEDGFAQLDRLLSQYDDLDAIHLVSHGADGIIQLGSSWLTASNIDQYADELSRWGMALDQNGDFLIYGCNVAQGTLGQDFLNTLSNAMGTDIAASNDLTGHEKLGGDWDLEWTNGTIETQRAMSEQLMASWMSSLVTATFQEGVSGYSGTNDTFLDQLNPTNNNGAAIAVEVDLDAGASDTAHGLISFSNIFGSGKIPYGVTINSASLTVNVTNVSDAGATIGLYRMLTGWTEASTWNSMTAGISANGVEAMSTADSVLSSPASSGSVTFTGLASVLQAWLNGTSTNNGWAIISNSSNGWDVSSSENGTSSFRPILTVDYTIPTNTVTVSNSLDVSNGTTTSIAALIASDGGDGISLREAIDAANNTSGADTIRFQISSGSQTINIATGLSTISEQVTIDASTQLGFAGTPLIILDGNNTTADGFYFNSNADNSTLRGFVIRDFNGDGIEIDANATGITIAGNYIGRLNASGTDSGVGEENSGMGIRVLGANNTIGGTGTYDRNVISGNTLVGINLTGSSANNNAIVGNYIGTTATGLVDLGNFEDGIQVDSGASNNTIGGLTTASRNIISGNDNAGIAIDNASTSGTTVQGNYIGLGSDGSTSIANTHNGINVNAAINTTIGSTDPLGRNVIGSNTIHGIGITDATTTTIIGNYIGVDAAGTLARGNLGDGIRVQGIASGTRIGGTSTAHSNRIANNSGDGILVSSSSSTAASILGNQIYANGEQAIDLGSDDGITFNDILDADTGSNGLLNFPILNSAISSGGNTTITGKMLGVASTTFRIEFFRTPYGEADTSGYGEGKVFIGSASVTTNASGYAAISTIINSLTLQTGDLITATATVDLGAGNYGGTSEFAGNILGNQPNLMITGSYVGNAADNRAITGLGFRPEVVIVLPNASAMSYMKTSAMAGDTSKSMTGSNGILSDRIQSLNGDGFTIGTDSAVNTNGTTYYYVAFGASEYLDVGMYTGNGTSQTVSSLGFSPEMVWLGANSTQTMRWESSLSTNTYDFSTGIYGTSGITGLTSDGFSVDNNASVNQNSTTIYYLAWSQSSDYFTLANYTGNGVDNRNMTGVGFEPELVFTREVANSNFINVKIEASGYNTDATGGFGNFAHTYAGYIQAIQSDGFQLSQDGELNGNGVSYSYWAFNQKDAPLIVDTTSDASDGTVTSINNLRANKGADGKISLREAIAAANATHNGTLIDQIQFNIAGAGVHSITVGATALPSITDAVKIDAWSEPDYSGTPVIELNGNNAGSSLDGFRLASGSSGSTIRGFIINRFTGDGIEINSSSNNVIEGNWIGLSSSGLSASANSHNGIRIHGNASGNTIGGTTAIARNIISGNNEDGIYISDAGTHSNTVAGNYIGLAVDGDTEVANIGDGISIVSGATNNVLGGLSSASRNVIAGNNGFGVYLSGNSNSVLSNYIGTNAAGTLARANIDGIYIDGAASNIIGQTGAGNLISGNEYWGIIIDGIAAISNSIQANSIGTNAAGSAVVANGATGVLVRNAATNTIIGGSAAGAGNTISGNAGSGIAVQDAGTTGTIVRGNRIGTDITGEVDLGNAANGIDVSVSNTTIGGLLAGGGNIVSGNQLRGIYVTGGSTTNVVISGNYVGTDDDGLQSIGNTFDGIEVSQGAGGVTIQNNLVATNGQWGIIMAGAGAGSAITGNTVGLNVTQSSALGGSGMGLYNSGHTITSNTIGGTSGYGIFLSDSANNIIQDNYIGTNSGGVASLGNAYQGIGIVGAGSTGNLIGGTSGGQRNIIAFNVYDGIALSSSAGSGNSILGNSFYSNGGLGIDLHDNGVTGNDAGDADSGANNLQNHPLLTSAFSTGGDTTIAGSINSNLSTTFRIEFFSNPAGTEDATGHGEGRVYLGFTEVTTNGSGNATFNVELSGVTVATGDRVTATATVKTGGSTYGSTSEFALNVIASSNTAPVLDNTGTMTLTTITEDQVVNIGTTIADLIASAGGDRITDFDSGAVEGIAITALNSGNGAWEYSTDGGSNWFAIGSVSNTSALLLRSTDLVRLVPNGQNGTTADFTFRAWDQTSGTVGTKVDVSTNGTSTAFSTATEDASINVTAVNDAPVLTPYSPTVNLTEDSAAFTATVASVLDISVTDVDSGAVQGIAIYSFSTSAGAVEYSTNGGGTWQSVGTVSATNALLLRSTDLLRFTPNSQNGGSISCIYHAWDQTTGTAGTNVDASTTGGTTAFSIASENIVVNISSINDAPVLDNSGTMTLTTITEDQTSNSGQTIASVIASAGGNRIVDFDSGAVEGIAITALNSGNGTWEYSTDSGSSWSAVGAVSNTSALLLRATDLVRFVPNGQNATTGDFTFRAWDQTTGTFGTKVDVSTNGGATAFSTATEVASITVTAINDAPVLTVNAFAFNEGGYHLVTLANLNASDVDSTYVGLTFAISNVVGGRFESSINPGSSIDAFTIADVIAGKIVFLHNGSETSPSFNVQVTDGSLITTSVAANISFTNLNDYPLIDLNGLGPQTVVNTTTTGNQAGPETLTLDNGNYVVSWRSNNDLYARIYSVNGTAVTGEFQLDDTTQVVRPQLLNDGQGGFVAVWTNGDTLHIRGFDADGVPASANSTELDFGDGLNRDEADIIRLSGGEYVLGYRRWSNVSLDEGDIAFIVLDGGFNFIGTEIDVPDVGAGTQAGPKLLAMSNGNFVVAYTDYSGLDGDGAGVYAKYYKSLGTAISSANLVADTSSGSQILESMVELSSNTVLITWRDSTIDGNTFGIAGKVFDSDGATIIGEFQISQSDAGVQQDSQIVAFSNGTFAVVWNSVGADGDGDIFIRHFQDDGTALSDEMLVNTSSFGAKSKPVVTLLGQLEIAIAWEDSAADGNGTAIVMRRFDLSIHTVTYTENDTPIAIHDGVFLTDFDDTTLSSATVQFSSNYQNGQDVLAFIDQNGITGSWDANTGILTLSGVESVVKYQTALRSITYANSSEAPEPNARILTWTVEDSSGSGYTRTSKIVVVPVNDEQVLTSNTGSTVAENSIGNTVSSAMLLTTDADHTTSQRVYTVTTASTNGTLRRSGTALTTNSTFTQADINSGLITYDHNGSETSSDSFSFSVDDGVGSTSTGTFNFTIASVNDNNPVITSNGSGNTASINVAENFTAVTTVIAIDADVPSQTITYSISGGADASLFAIDSNTGALTFVSGRNRESHSDADTNGIYEVTVRASDGTNIDSQDISVTITDIDEFDTGAVTDSNAAANSVAENAANGTVVGITGLATDLDATTNTITYSLDDSASGKFTIDGSTGVVIVNSALDYEATTSHNITIRATSADGSFSTQTFTINLTDVNEAAVGSVSDSNAAANYVLENASNGTSVGVQALAVDPDGTDVVTYSLDSNAGGRFTIDANTGVVTVNGAIDREAAASYNITIRATSSDTSFSTQSFTINIGDADEFDVTAPSDSNAAANSVNENAANGTVVGITASASDSDATTNTVTYSLFNNAGGRFAIDANTGIVTVADGTLLDREAAASHNITVRATSADGSTADTVFTINLNDVDEFDTSAVSDTNAAANSVAENAANGTAVGITAFASDADATTNTISYSLDNNAGGRFAIDANTGVVTVADGTLLDYEAATSHGITVRATSADGSFGTQNYTIQLTDVNEAGVGSVSDSNAAANYVLENASNGTLVGVQALAVDPDRTDVVTYSLDNNAGGRFAIDANTGIVTVADGTLLDREAAASHNITVRATSADGSTADTVFTINVMDVNENPFGTGDVYSTSYIDTLTIGASGILANDGDPDGDMLTTVLISGPAVGTLTLNSDGSFSYVPQANFVGTVTFVYQNSDGLLNSGPIVVTVQVVVPTNLPSGGGGSGGGNGTGGGNGNGNDGGTTIDRDQKNLLPIPEPQVDLDVQSSTDSRTDPSMTPQRSLVTALKLANMANDQRKQAELEEWELSSSMLYRYRELSFVERRLHDNNPTSYRRIYGESHETRRPEFAMVKTTFDDGKSMVEYVTPAIVSSVVGTGMIIWIVRGAQLLTAILSVSPAWIQLDPISVLPKVVDCEDDEEATEEERLFAGTKRGRRSF